MCGMRGQPAGAASRIWDDLARSRAHGPLPILLLLLTVATGVIDAVSILGLGRVFVANMTGNVVFVGFAVAGAPGFSLSGSVAALVGFLVGAGVGGGLVDRFGGHRGHLLRNVTAVEFVLVGSALAVVAGGATTVDAPAAVAAAALLAVAMGMQNTAVRRLAVPDLTTTVLTMTLTGIAADLRRAGVVTAVRRLLAVLAMFAGAAVGAVSFLVAGIGWALAGALLVIGIVAGVATLRSRRAAEWQHDRR
jgi:uncharacterized membrane protein YoaK (UPF0700 family)